VAGTPLVWGASSSVRPALARVGSEAVGAVVSGSPPVGFCWWCCSSETAALASATESTQASSVWKGVFSLETLRIWESVAYDQHII